MNQYLFKYDDEQKQFRNLLSEHFTKKRGRRVPYNEILADLQREAVRKLKL